MQNQSPVLKIWMIGRDEHSRLIFAIASAFIGVALGMLPYFSAAKIIVGLYNESLDMTYYMTYLALGLAGYIGRTLLYTLALSQSHKATFSILKSIRRRILDKLPRLPLGTVMDMPSGKMKQIIVDQVDSMETTLAHLFPEMTANLAGPLLILIYLFILDWKIALLSLLSLPVGILFMMTVMGSYARDYEGAVKTTQAMNETIVEYIGGIEVIKAFNQGSASYAKFSDRIIANAAYYYNWMKKSQFGMSMGYAVSPAALITVLPGGWFLYRSGSLSVETFITSVILSLGIAGPLLSAMSFVDTLAQVGTTVATAEELLEAEEQQHKTAPVSLSGTDIKLSNVSFGYHKDQEILKNIDLNIPAGSITALVGPSGSGKSTIAKLIAGFWDVRSGSITIGGIDERDIPLSELYDCFAFVSQDNYLFDDTIRENIRMGKLTATDAEVEAAAETSGCGAFIRELENGFDTKTGSSGAHLSGGERQRIAIARAMLKDAPVIILDEATAYIDPENEAIIQAAIGKLVKGKTVIIIAHRLSTIKDADRIIVVKDGGIEATGTHDELRSSCPLYESMWQAHIGAKDGDEE